MTSHHFNKNKNSDPFASNTAFHSSFTESFSNNKNGTNPRQGNNNISHHGSVEGSNNRRISVAVKRRGTTTDNDGNNSNSHVNTMNLQPVELIPEPSLGTFDPFHVSNPNHFASSFSMFGDSPTKGQSHKNRGVETVKRNSTSSGTGTGVVNGRKSSLMLLSSSARRNSNNNNPFLFPFTSSALPTTPESNSPTSHHQRRQSRRGDDYSLEYSPLFKENHHHSARSSSKRANDDQEINYYDEDKRKSIVQQQVDAAKKRQLGIYSARALEATTSSKAKTTPKNVGLAEARRLHDPNSVASKLSIGPKHCQVKTALKWLSKLSGDPIEEKKREARRAAEIANSQIARRRMSECESERRLLNLTQSMKSEMATFLNHLLDWASSGSAAAGRRNETEKQLAENVANRESARSPAHAVAGTHHYATSNPHHSDGIFSSSASTLSGILGGSRKNQNNGNNHHRQLSPEEQRELSHQTSWSFLRASSKAAGNAVLTVDAFAVLRSFFDLLDADGSGSLTLDEIEAAAQLIGREESQLVAAMKTVDKDQSGAIDFVEIVKVFFPTLSLSQISRFERTHREEITKRMDPRVRMDPEDIKDIEETYALLERMKPGGCSFDNMLSLMSDYMKERPDVVRDAFYLYDKDHNGHLTADEFFDFMKFSYPPYSFAGVSTKEEEAHAKRRSLISTEQQREEEELEQRKKKQAQQLLEAEKKKKQQGGSGTDLMASVRNDSALKSMKHGLFGDGENGGGSSNNYYMNDDEPEISHVLPKKMIVPNPPKTGLGSNPNSIASAWSTGNLAAITMERQKDREKKERLELRALRKKQKELMANAHNNHHHHHGTNSNGSSSSNSGVTNNNNNNSNNHNKNSAGGGGAQKHNSSSKNGKDNRRTSMGVRSSSTSGESRARSSSNQSGRSPSSSSLSGNGLDETRSTVAGDINGRSSSKKRKRKGKDDHQDDDDSDSDEHEAFSLEALAEARWKIVRENLSRDPAAVTSTILLGTRDLPPVDSLKNRHITEHFRRHGTLPEIASARNLLIIARDDIEREKRVAEERNRIDSNALRSARRKISSETKQQQNHRPNTARNSSSMMMMSPASSPNRTSGFDLIAKATTNFLALSAMNQAKASSTLSTATTTFTKTNSGTGETVVDPTTNPNSTSTPATGTLLSFTTTATALSTLNPSGSPFSSQTFAPQNKSRGGDGGVEVDVETAKAASAMFAPRMTITKRLEKTLGGEYFTAGGNFSPEKVHRSKQTALMLERIKSKIIEPTPRSARLK